MGRVPADSGPLRPLLLMLPPCLLLRPGARPQGRWLAPWQGRGEWRSQRARAAGSAGLHRCVQAPRLCQSGAGVPGVAVPLRRERLLGGTALLGPIPAASYFFLPCLSCPEPPCPPMSQVLTHSMVSGGFWCNAPAGLSRVRCPATPAGTLPRQRRTPCPLGSSQAQAGWALPRLCSRAGHAQLLQQAGLHRLPARGGGAAAGCTLPPGEHGGEARRCGVGRRLQLRRPCSLPASAACRAARPPACPSLQAGLARRVAATADRGRRI